VPTLVSYGGALTAPGNTSLSIRSTEWMRSHHFRWLVDDAENFWYTHHQPKKGGLPPSALRAQLSGVTHRGQGTTNSGVTGALPAPAPIRPFAATPLLNEGVWRPLGQTVGGQPAMYVTYLRPDAVHTSLVAGVAWIDPKLVKAVGYAGLSQPGGTGWANQVPIPDAVRPNLIAAFNSGFKMADAEGGYYAAGRYAAPLRLGAATMWITADGTMHVGQWGRDVTMGPNVVFARQNLSLIVDGGQPVPGVDTANPAKWGVTVANAVLVWRSGLGVTSDGALVYAAGPGLSALSLARLLARAGAVRAMELDINSAWVDFFTYAPAPAGAPAADLTVNKLLVDMSPSIADYLTPSDRDFIALFRR